MRRFLVKLSKIAIAKRAAKKAKERLHSKNFPYVFAIDGEIFLKYPDGNIERIKNEFKKIKIK